jgi:hypothetical protein
MRAGDPANFYISMNTRAFLIPARRGAAILFAALASTAVATAATPATGTDTTTGNPFGAKTAVSAAAPATNADGTPGNPFGPKPAATPGTPGQATASTDDGGIAALRAMLLQRFDKTGAGVLNGAEQAEARSVLSSGAVTQSLTPAQAQAAAKGPLFGLRPLLDKYLDRNGDGVFDAAELAEIHRVLFANAVIAPPAAGDLDALRKDVVSTFDKNGDGKLDDAERAAAKTFLQQELADLNPADGGSPAGGKNSPIPPHPSIPQPKGASASGPVAPAGSGDPAR